MSIAIENNYYSKNKNLLKVKRCFDIFFSVIGLLLLSPCFAIIALLIKTTSKGNILFKHRRIGYMGKEIIVYKFRTMKEGSEEYSRYFTAEQIAEFNENYKLKEDPRVTSVGKFLRKTSLDELPQIINVLIGNMSVVGPRPVTKEELTKYGDYKEMLFSIKPGITGLWQVNGRSDTTYDDRVKLDIHYISNANLLSDIKIIFKTFVKVIIREGVY